MFRRRHRQMVARLGKFGERAFFVTLFGAFILLTASGCSDFTESEAEADPPTRAESIPADAVKMTPETDAWPPITLSDEWEQPVPMSGPVNTAGAEDAPVFSTDGNTFVFFFTPDLNIPAEQQVLDGVTGIWYCTRTRSGWTEPERARLIDAGELSMDGPFCMAGDLLWFGSIRAGNYREIDIYVVEFADGAWTDWRNAGYLLNVEYWVGELYTTAGGGLMVYDSDREGGYGAKDLWLTRKEVGVWGEPVNLGPEINTELDEGWPYLSSDGNELWFTRWSVQGYMGPSLFRSVKSGDGWGEPEEIVANFAGDPAMDADGNLYFTHHYFTEDLQMIEADIYVAHRR